MKRKITKADFESLPEELKKEYSLKGDTATLKLDDVDVDTLESRVTAMDSKITELLGEKKTEKEKREAAEEEARIAKQKKDGDVEALEASWQTKLDKQKETYEGRINVLTSGMEGLASGAEATRIASEIALPGSASVLLPHLRSRLATQIGEDGKPKVVVLDAEGKPSAMSVKELTEEIRTSPDFAPIIVGSKGSGAGHHDKGGSGGSGEKGNLGGTPAERTAALKAKHPELQ